MTFRPSEKVQFGVLPLVGRLLLVAEFLVALNGKISDWSGQAAYMKAHGMTMVGPLLGVALAIELVGSLCIIAGYRARTAAVVMAGYLAVVSIRLHDFWNAGPASMSQTEFFKNAGIIGGLLLLAAYGPGRWALRGGVNPSP
jgi:putative oxidoreductase